MLPDYSVKHVPGLYPEQARISLTRVAAVTAAAVQ